MATLVLQLAGGALGAAVAGPAGAVVGRALGAMAGAAIDSSLLSALDGRKAGTSPALTDVPGLSSTEGAAIARVYGRARVGGQLIWASRIERVASFATERSGFGGKGALGAMSQDGEASWSYFANLAIGVCEGPVAFIRRVWADGEELDLAGVVMRVHTGEATQAADPLIVAKEGAEAAPAYRGLAYVVFERLALARYNSRIPQFSFEVVRPLNGLRSLIRAVNLIPGATEYGYDPQWRVQMPAPGVSTPENRRQLYGPTDVSASLDALQALCPALERVAVVVSWFGDDLRCGHCAIAPRVEAHERITTGDPWMVSGVGRAATERVSSSGGQLAYGGTPSDAAIIRLVHELNRRGLAVTLYPFVMMDIAPGNDRPDPRQPEAGQPAYPWRGRITCHPAPGVAGSPDATAEAAEQVAAFFGDATAAQFLPYFATVAFMGTPQWSYRRFILHYARLASMTGGVSGFIIGSEFVGLTRVRGEEGYAATAHFAAIATEARSVLGSDVALTYAADWTEYGAHVRDGGGEVDFPLDDLWAAPEIDAVGVDYYPPLSDWRDGEDHADASLASSIYDVDYLIGRAGAGEAFDYYYADAAARAAGLRTPITDAAFSKPWLYRAKDLVNWWSQPHVRRSGGVETSATAWTPGGKPLWLTEIGVPAVDRGANGPNVFPDAKSSENALPPQSRGGRDDLMQLRGLEAMIRRFDQAAGALEAWNPSASLYAGRMIDPAHIYVWAWDARPFPAFPAMGDAWGDAAAWWTGHWITGRLEGAELGLLARRLLDDLGMPRAGVTVEPGVEAVLDGYVVDRPMSARDALQPLCDLYGFHAVASAGAVRFTAADTAGSALDAALLAPATDGALFELTRSEASGLPLEIRLGFTDSDGDYRRAAAVSRRLGDESVRRSNAELSVVTHRAEAARRADDWLQRIWQGREQLTLRLSPRAVALEPGDVVSFDAGDGARAWRVTRIVDGDVRQVSAEACVQRRAGGGLAPLAAPGAPAPALPGPPLALTLDLPAAISTPETLQHLAVFADPWPGAMTLWRSSDGEHFRQIDQIVAPALVGETTTALGPGPLWRLDHAGWFEAVMRGGALASVDDASLFEGANLFALLDEAGDIEIVGAGRIVLCDGVGAARRWRFSRLLRGLGGSEAAAGRMLAVGARVVAVDGALSPLTRDRSDLGRTMRYRIGPSGRDHGDAAVVAFAATPGLASLRPMPPVQVRAWRTLDGVRIGFVRRSRFSGEGWDAAEPSVEGGARHEIDIYAGGAVARTLTGETAPMLYPAAQELVDFGAPQTALDVAVAQASAVAGRGFATRRLLAIG